MNTEKSNINNSCTIEQIDTVKLFNKKNNMYNNRKDDRKDNNKENNIKNIEIKDIDDGIKGKIENNSTKNKFDKKKKKEEKEKKYY